MSRRTEGEVIFEQSRQISQRLSEAVAGRVKQVPRGIHSFTDSFIPQTFRDTCRGASLSLPSPREKLWATPDQVFRMIWNRSEIQFHSVNIYSASAICSAPSWLCGEYRKGRDMVAVTEDLASNWGDEIYTHNTRQLW